MKRFPLIAFFALMFAISWGIWFPLAAVIQNAPDWARSSHLPAFLQVLGAFGPCFAALVVTGVVDGVEGLRQLFRRLLVWRVNVSWYVVALLLPAAISLLITVIHMMFGGDAPDFTNPPIYAGYGSLPQWMQSYTAWTILIPVFLIQLITGSSVGEELGWRGFALTRLQRRLSALDASLIIAVVWAVWAQPLFHLQRVQAGPWLTVEDFRNLPRLVQRLQRGTDPVSRLVQRRLSPPLRSVLLASDSSPDSAKALQFPLLVELNQILNGPSLYDAQRFKEVRLSAATYRLLDSKPQGLRLARLNRLLLQQAYPGDIGKSFSVYFLPFILLLIGVIPAQILITWLYNSTGGSLLLVVLYNNALKTTDLFVAAPNAGQVVSVAAYWLVTLLIVSAVGTKRLTLRTVSAEKPTSDTPAQDGSLA